MRRILAIFLLALLPYQFAWSAAAVYCQHEDSSRSADVSHFGHHSHVHTAQPSQDGSSPSPDNPLVDNDCGVCHLSVVKSLTVGVDNQLTESPQSLRAVVPSPLQSCVLAGLERPKWFAV